MKIWFMTLEKIETRYTCEWYKQFKEVFKQQKIDFEYIDGEHVDSKLEGKFFLDPVGTNLWKLSQMKKLISRIHEVQDDDVIFFADLWFPSIEMLPYIKHLTGKKFKIVGILHAGTYDPYDLTAQSGMSPWGELLEESWFKFVDKIFVATKFHKHLICQNRRIKPQKIVVVGLPINCNQLGFYERKKLPQIIFTGRKSEEKGFDIVEKLIKEGYNIKIALDMNLKKRDYYRLLGKSAVVFAPSLQETFGYGIVEGMAMNTIPIVPNRLSYKEIVPKKYRYNNIQEAKKMLCSAVITRDLGLKSKVTRYHYTNVIKRMIEECKNV